jgi:O-antigen ligase
MSGTDTAYNAYDAELSVVPLRVAVRVLPVATVAVAAAVVAWREHGSLAAPDWLPLAILVALIGAVVAAAGAARRPPRALVAGAAGLLALAAWTAVTIAWAPSPAGARDEALLTLLYAAVVAVGGSAVAGERERRTAAGVVAATVGVLAAAVAVDVALAAAPSSFFFFGRLDAPVSYVNAASALFVLALWPALVLASVRTARPVWRIGGIATGALVLALAIAGQSKGTMLGLAVSATVVLALAPGRLRLLPPLVAAVVPAVALAPVLTAPYRSDTAHAQHGVGVAALAAAALAAALGAAYVAADRRIVPSAAARAIAARAVALLLVAAAAAGVVAFAAAVPSPRTWASDTWASFKHPGGGGSTHLTSLGSNRYDFWRVALDEARAHPLRGLGGRGFYSAYLQHRRSDETPLRAHSLYLDVLSEEGLPGFALLVVALGVPLAAAARRRGSPAALAATGGVVSFLAHAAVDWIWTVPVVGIVALLLLGVAASPDRDEPLPRRASLAAAAAGVAAAALAFAPPWLAHRYVAAADLATARRLDPLSLDADWAAWRLATTPAARAAALERARRQEPTSVAVLYQLGLAEEAAGRRAAAHAAFARALELDPREASVRDAVRRTAR